MSVTDVQGTLTQIKNSTASANYEKNKASVGNSELGQDAFLQLLMTQIQNQDPLNPMDSQQFMAQQAQFTQISELQKLNKNVVQSNQISQASSLIGLDVSVTDPNDENKTINGVVSEAKITDSGASVVMDGKEYPLDSIISVKKQPAS